MPLTTPKIQTQRVLLRAVRQDDAPDMFAYARNPNVLRYISGKTPTALAETESFVKSMIDKPPGAFAWAICLKGNPRVIGAVEFDIADDATGQIDYALAEEHWNQGIMTEVVRAVLVWAFKTHLGLDSVCSPVMTANEASIRVLEKCGLEWRKQVHQKWKKFSDPVELSIYAISREKWQRSNH